jgi:hypothetical protein
MDPVPTVVVEFYGMARRKSQRAELTVTAANVADALHAVARQCPQLGDLLQADGQVAPHYLVSVDGRGFLADPNYVVRNGERLLVLSADAGG